MSVAFRNVSGVYLNLVSNNFEFWKVVRYTDKNNIFHHSQYLIAWLEHDQIQTNEELLEWAISIAKKINNELGPEPKGEG